MFIVLGIGAVFTFVFHIGTKERIKPVDDDLSSGRDVLDSVTSSLSSVEKSGSHRSMKWSCWLKDSQFYQVIVLSLWLLALD